MRFCKSFSAVCCFVFLSPGTFKSIAVQPARPKGNQNASLSFDDVCKMANFSLALGCQISEANKSNRGKVIAEGVIGGTLILSFAALLVANHPIQLPSPDNGTLKAKMAELARLYHLR